MRWNDEITLLSARDAWQDDEGAWHEGDRSERVVYCNHGTLGLMTMSQLHSSEVRITSGESVPEAGLREMHVVYVREVDYEGEDQVVFHGKEMEVIATTSEGENLKMIIRRRLGND